MKDREQRDEAQPERKQEGHGEQRGIQPQPIKKGSRAQNLSGQASQRNFKELKRFIQRYSQKLSLQSNLQDGRITFDYMHFRDFVL